jgi:hypothetical protein
VGLFASSVVCASPNACDGRLAVPEAALPANGAAIAMTNQTHRCQENTAKAI